MNEPVALDKTIEETFVLPEKNEKRHGGENREKIKTSGKQRNIDGWVEIASRSDLFHVK